MRCVDSDKIEFVSFRSFPSDVVCFGSKIIHAGCSRTNDEILICVHWFAHVSVAQTLMRLYIAEEVSVTEASVTKTLYSGKSQTRT